MIVGEFGLTPLGRLESTIVGNNMLSLAAEIRTFYEDSTASDSRSSGSESESLDFFMKAFAHPHFIRRSRFESIPRFVRLEVGEKPVALVAILADSIRYGHNLPFEWMKTMLLSTEIIRPLVEKCRDFLPDLLNMLGKYRFVYAPSKLLRVQDTQRILKIARGTDDPNTLAGIATALVSAGFLRIAETELILRLLQVDSNILLASVLFKINKVLTEDRDMASLTKEIGLIEKVARGVLGKPEVYPFQIVCQASDFLAEHSRVELPPLLQEEERLGIRLQFV